MKTEAEIFDEDFAKLKELVKVLPIEDQRIVYWVLLRDSIKDDFRAVMWLYDEMSRLVDREYVAKQS